MPSYWDAEKGLRYVKSNISLSPTHGGGGETGGNQALHAWEHDLQINEIVDQKIDMVLNQIERTIEQMIIEYGRNIWQQLIKNIVGAIETDVTTQVDISLADMNDILHSERTRKHISDNIMRAMINELNKIKNIDIKL